VAIDRQSAPVIRRFLPCARVVRGGRQFTARACGAAAAYFAASSGLLAIGEAAIEAGLDKSMHADARGPERCCIQASRRVLLARRVCPFALWRLS